MTLTDSERLIRIETLLQAQAERDAERDRRWEAHEARLQRLEWAEQRRTGGAIVISAIAAGAAAAGGLVVKFWPFSK